MHTIDKYIEHLLYIYNNSPNFTFLVDNKLNILWKNDKGAKYTNIFLDNMLNINIFSFNNNIIIKSFLEKDIFSFKICNDSFKSITVSFFKICNQKNLFVAFVDSSDNLDDHIKPQVFNDFSNHFREIVSSNDIVHNAINKMFSKNPSRETDIYMDILVRNNFKLFRQVNNMTIFNKLQNNMVEEMHYINIKDFLNGIFQSINSIIPNSLAIPFNYNVLNKDTFMSISPEYLTIAISNIISNSLIFTQDNNRIDITTLKRNNSIIITIKDCGIGMHTDILANCRKPFFSYSPDNIYISVGLGLTICNSIISMHNGSMLISSEYGTGTTVTLTIPIEKNIADNNCLNTKYESYIKDRFSPIYISLCDISILPI